MLYLGIMTNREAEILAILLAFDEELVYEAGQAYVGTVRTNTQLVFSLLSQIYISLTGDSKFGVGLERYQINETGRDALCAHWGLEP